MATKIGEYSVQSGGAAVSFWPLNPGTTVAQATPPAPVAPVNPNLIVPPPTFVIFDVVIRFTDEPVETAIADPALLAHVSGAVPNNSMPLTKEADGSAHICFAVPCGAANFEGRLRLSADRTNPNKNIAIQLPIKAAVNTRTEDLFVFFVVHDFGLPNPPPYGWVKVLM